jgi:hypothetical protein
MRSLLLRLSALDADAATAFRVIAFFDALVEHHASAEALVRALSGLAECGCGMQLADGRQWRFAPDGQPLSGPAHIVSAQAQFDANDIAGRLWLERPDGPGPFDDLILERASLAAHGLLADQRPRRTAGLVDPSLMEVVLSTQESLADRCRALRALGLIPNRPLRVAAVSVDPDRDPAVEVVSLIARAQTSRSAHVAVVGSVAAVLFSQQTKRSSPAPELRSALRHQNLERPNSGVQMGIGAEVNGTEAARSWQQALLAMRFATPPTTCLSAGDYGEPVLDYDELGVLALLADIPRERLTGDPCVSALDAFGASESGAVDIATLEVYCRTGSLRRAAEALYLHHSTVSFRLARIEKAMNWHLDDPADRFRAQFALLARRLVHASAPP